MRVIEWDGPSGGDSSIFDEDDDNSPNKKQKKRPSAAPFLYATMFSRKQDLIFAGGAGKNEFRIFDYETGNIVCIISDMERSIMCMDIAKKST